MEEKGMSNADVGVAPVKSKVVVTKPGVFINPIAVAKSQANKVPTIKKSKAIKKVKKPAAVLPTPHAARPVAKHSGRGMRKQTLGDGRTVKVMYSYRNNY